MQRTLRKFRTLVYIFLDPLHFLGPLSTFSQVLPIKVLKFASGSSP
jgi:hypothetical protein